MRQVVSVPVRDFHYLSVARIVDIWKSMQTEIKVAEILKTFNTIGEVRYICNFMACEGNWCVDRNRSQHKSEKSAIKKLEDLKAKHGFRFAASFNGVK